MYSYADKDAFEKSKLYLQYVANRLWFLSIAQRTYEDATFGGKMPHKNLDLDSLVENIAEAIQAPRKWKKIIAQIDPWMLDHDMKECAKSVSLYMVYAPPESGQVFRISP
jgi:hypothetical protein